MWSDASLSGGVVFKRLRFKDRENPIQSNRGVCAAVWLTRYSDLHVACFNMSLRSQGPDIPEVECMTGPQTGIHVTGFSAARQRVTLRPYFFILYEGQWDQASHGGWLVFFLFSSGRNVLHADKHMCVSLNWVWTVVVRPTTTATMVNEIYRNN